MTTIKGGEAAIACPKCGTTIEITRALSAQAERQLREQFEADRQRSEDEQRKGFERKLREVKDKAVAEAKEAQLVELEDLRQQVTTRDAQVEGYRKAELEFRQRSRELEDGKKALELETELRLQEVTAEIEAVVTHRMAEQHRIDSLAKDKKLADLQQQLEEAHRRAQQGSQQTQGEALEVDLETTLQQEFPQDRFTPVEVGQRGADLLQEVRDPRGAAVGCILWEGKNTKNFSEKWLAKLREDQRGCGALVAVLVTKSMPGDIVQFGQRDGVWVASPAAALPLAHVLRFGLIEAARARVASQNQNEKQAALYAYLSGIEFKQRIEGILDPLMFLLNEHDRDERAHHTAAARREKAIKQALTSLAVLYGAVGGVVGGVLPRIQQLELPPAAGDHAA